MAQIQPILLLACFLVWSTASDSMHGTSSLKTSRVFLNPLTETDLESDVDLSPAECNDRSLCSEPVNVSQSKESHSDSSQSRIPELLASRMELIPETSLSDLDTDSELYDTSRARSLLQASSGEADALLDFIDGIQNYADDALDNWTSSGRSDYCSWARVTCDDEMHVTSLKLSSLHMNGTLSPSLSKLTYLKELHLDQNNLTGEIPPELGQLSSLRVLNLEDNLLFGRIPRELGNLSSLQYLNLGSEGYWFNGTIPEELGQLTDLEFLNFGSLNNFGMEDIYHGYDPNTLRGPIPRSLANCTKLRYLDFYGNSYLTGSIPEDYGRLSNLEYLSFEQNLFTGPVPRQLGNLSKVFFLHFGNNALGGRLPVELANISTLVLLNVGTNVFSGNLLDVKSTSWSKLEQFYIDGNNFEGEFPELVFSSTNLVFFYMNGNNFTGKLPAKLGTMKKLRSFVIRNNLFHGEIPETFTNMSSLIRLDVANNQLTGTLDPLRNLTRVQYLNLGSSSDSKEITWESLRGRATDLVQNSFTGSLTDELVSQWSKLEFLYLDTNSLTGPLPAALGNLTSLKHLLLNSNKFTGTIPDELGKLQNLTLLWLQDNKLTGSVPAALAHLQTVTEINIANNTLTGSIPAEFGNLTEIRYLRLQRNNLSGEIPASLGRLQNLVYLILYNNTLNGSIPESLSNCSALENVRLSYNSLSGTLTQLDFAQLTSLQSFSANVNFLTGDFPATVWRCEQLELLDLSRNHLSGVIPSFDNPNKSYTSSLRVLSLASNNFSGLIPPWVWKLAALQVLDLSENAFTGSLPDDLTGLETYRLPLYEQEIDAQISKGILYEQISLRKGDAVYEYAYVLEVFTALDLSSNQLTGKLPSLLSTLQSLRYINLASNRFDGPIPGTLGKIRNLVSLDISNNLISGPIPVSMSMLNLDYLNLSLNQLCGPIPTSDAFDTRYMTTSFLPGNAKLCGIVLNRSCPRGSTCDPDLPSDTGDSISDFLFDEEFVKAFGIGLAIGLVTVFAAITIIPFLRKMIFVPTPGTMTYAPIRYGAYREPK
ncbi:hypothetical protein Mapa_004046 [Marchantia paleacea]|nr:hypothetical protein Mapa_004046 [Marchantia paleacea]